MTSERRLRLRTLGRPHRLPVAAALNGGVWRSLVSVERRWFTWHMNVYRLLVGAVVLSIVLPASAAGVQAMWVVGLVCIVVVLCAVIVGTRVAPLKEWLRR